MHMQQETDHTVGVRGAPYWHSSMYQQEAKAYACTYPGLCATRKSPTLPTKGGSLPQLTENTHLLSLHHVTWNSDKIQIVKQAMNEGGVLT